MYTHATWFFAGVEARSVLRAAPSSAAATTHTTHPAAARTRPGTAPPPPRCGRPPPPGQPGASPGPPPGPRGAWECARAWVSCRVCLCMHTCVPACMGVVAHAHMLHQTPPAGNRCGPPVLLARCVCCARSGDLLAGHAQTQPQHTRWAGTHTHLWRWHTDSMRRSMITSVRASTPQANTAGSRSSRKSVTLRTVGTSLPLAARACVWGAWVSALCTQRKHTMQACKLHAHTPSAASTQFSSSGSSTTRSFSTMGSSLPLSVCRLHMSMAAASADCRLCRSSRRLPTEPMAPGAAGAVPDSQFIIIV